MTTYCRPTMRRPFSMSAGGVGLEDCEGADGLAPAGLRPTGACDPLPAPGSFSRAGAGWAETPPAPKLGTAEACDAPLELAAPLRVPTSRTPRSTGPAATSSDDCDASADAGPRPM